MRELLKGAVQLPRALGALRRDRSLWRYVLIPIAVNLIVAAVAYTALLIVGLQIVNDLVTAASGLGAALEIVLRVLLVVLLLVATGFVVVRFGVVLGSPWYGRLSERLERARLGSAPLAQPLTVAGVTRDLSRAVAFEVKKLLLVLVIGAGLLALNFVPVAGQLLAGVGGVALAATIACLDFLDGPLERRRWRFREKLRYVRRSLPASAGFGLATVTLLSVPLLNLLSIPVCVAAGTLLFCDQERGRGVTRPH